MPNTRWPLTEERVEQATNPELNRRINRQIEANVLYCAQYPDRIEERLESLGREWDIERLLEANASAVTLLGALLGLSSRRWSLLPVGVGSFLLYHALKGWCPPIPILRRLGIRTTGEINRERYALKALRGDFRELGPDSPADAEGRASRALQAAGWGVAGAA